MQITIIAPGSQGDVQPFLALGKGLVNNGKKVRLVTNQNYEEQVKLYGLEFWPIEVSIEDIIRTEKMREVLESGKLLRSMAQMGKDLKQHAALLAKRSLDACQGVDMIMTGISGLFTAYSISESLDIPFVQAYNIPFTPTKSFSGALFPKFPSWLGYRFSHHLTRQMIWQAYRPTDKIVREDVLNLKKSPFFGPYNSEKLKNGPIIYGLSPSVINRPDDWSENIFLTGFWYLDPPENWNPPKDLKEFLKTEPIPLYIGFGSMSNKEPEEVTDLIINTLKKTNQRAVIFSGWGGLTSENLPDTVFMVDNLPHTWLFPKVRAVIHHGGAGTTAAGLRAGIPSVIVPYHGDQPFWGYLVESLGVGPTPIPRKKLNLERLVKAIEKVNIDQKIQEKAKILGKKIQTENGVSQALSIINQIVD
jgi:UDP:flavonoid glycosyltransferase YjiC (YdhE family)